MRNSPAAHLLENEETLVECTQCGVPMTSHLGSGGRVRYFRCSGCHRWVSTLYADVFRGDTKLRATHPERASGGLSFSVVKDRLERWLQALEGQDPYRALGVSPADSPEVVRARYRKLAMEHHPDRGGEADQMQRLNAAYERIESHQKRSSE